MRASGHLACRNVTADVQSGAGQRKSALVVDGLKRDVASASDGVGVSAKQDVGNGAAGWQEIHILFPCVAFW